MTIAVGIHCEEKLTIAADTQVAMTHGSTREEIMIKHAIAGSCIYVVANANEDGNAACTLITNVLTDLHGLQTKANS